MKNTNPDPAPLPADLRHQAEEKARACETQAGDSLSPDEIRRMLHELRVHQIELEMQNEELRRAQAELEAARARYFDLYDLAPVGYFTLCEKGLIQETNLTAAILLGVERKSLLKQMLTRFILPEDQDIYYRHRKQIIEVGTTLAFELRLVKKDGSAFWAHLVATATQAADGAPVCRITLSNITDRKRAEDERRKEHQRLAGILEGTHAGTWEWNVQTGETIFNHRWADIIGYTLEEISPVSIETWMKFAHPDDLKASDEVLEKHFRGELDYYEFESRMKHKDGSWVWVLDRGQVTSRTEDGKPLMMMGTHQDITDRKRAEERIRDLLAQSDKDRHALLGILEDAKRSAAAAKQEKDLNKTIIDSIPGAFYMLDARGQYVRWNAYQRDEIVGKPEDRVAGTNAIDTIHPDDRALVQSKIANVLSGNSVDETVEGRVLLRGGPAFRWLLMTGWKMTIDGNPFLVGIGIDVTERKLAEEKLRETLDEIQLSNRLMAGREERVLELKKEINDLLAEQGRPVRFRTT